MMDSVDQELHNEEIIHSQKELLKAVKNSKIVFAPSLSFPEKHKTEIVDVVRTTIENEVKLDESSIERLGGDLTKAVEILVDSVLKAVEQNKISSISIDNLSEARSDEVSVKNLKNLETLVSDLTKTIIASRPVINVEKQTITWPKLASEAIPVRLSDGGRFYNALAQAISSHATLPFLSVDGRGVQVQLDAQGKVPVSSSASTPSTVLNGKKTVTTAGTRVALASSTSCSAVIIRALLTNTGTIYVGNSSVASTNGHQLSPGESVGIAIDNLSSVYLDASVNGEGVTYLGS